MVIRGKNYLSASMIFGYIFSKPAGYVLEIEQGKELWTSDLSSQSSNPFIVTEYEESVNSDILYVQVNTTYNPVNRSVQNYKKNNHSSSDYPHVTIDFSLKDPTINQITNEMCTSMINQINIEIRRAIEKYNINQIFLFIAVPQAFAFFLGQSLNALPPIQLFEFDGKNYKKSLII